jgi:ABC-type branched-subunit amino acid transport system substrate-binding protein
MLVSLGANARIREDKAVRSKLIASLFCALLLLAGACSSDKKSSAGTGGTPSTNPRPPGAPIKLSVIAPVDGITAEPEILSGAEAAVAAINDAGGVTDPAGGPKRPLDLVECKLKATDDPEAKPLQCAKDAISAGVIADASKYAFSAPATKAFASAGVPLVGTLAVDAEDYTNAIVFMLSGGAVGVAGQGSALQNAGAKTIGLISADNPGGRFLPQFLKPVLENESDLVNETYLPLDPSVDVTPFVGRVMRANPDGVAIAESTDLNVKLVLALRQAGYQGKIALVASTLGPDAIKKLGSAADGLIAVASYEAPSTTTNPTIQRFVTEMGRFAKGAAQDEFSLNAWLTVHFIADELAKLKKIDATSLLAALNASPTVDLGVAPPFKLGDGKTFLKLPRVPRATVQYQKVEGGKIVRDGDFIDLDTLANK